MDCPSRDELMQLTGAPPPQLAEHLQGCATCNQHLIALARDRTGEVGPPLGLELVPTGPEAEGGDVPALSRGTNLGRFVVLDKLGEGGMGVVFVAYDRELDRKVALKLLTQGSGSSGSASSATDAQARLLREAQSMAQLSHPNVVAVYDVQMVDAATWGGAGQRVVMVMELVEGTTFKAWMKEKPRTPREVLEVLDAAGQGLAAAHDKGLTHRDFKPDNVLVGRDGRVRVADFGIARQDDAARPQEKDALATDEVSGNSRRHAALTQAGRIVGTPAYMAPEQLMGAKADARTDQFSFAVTLYEALAGGRPFTGGSLSERSKNVLEGRFEPLPQGVKLPSWLMKTVTRALAANPQQRYPSMRDLLTALRRDPARVRQRVFVGTVALALVVSAGAAVANQVRERSLLCTGAGAKLAGIWDAPRRGAIERAIQATGHASAATAWGQVDRTLSRYAQAWSALHEDACLATRVRGEQTEEVLGQRMACLEEQRQQLAAVADAFAKADARVVGRTPEVLNGLRNLGVCADLKLLRARVKPPTDPLAADKVAALRRKLADVLVLHRVGKYPEGLALANAALTEAKGLGYPPIEASALVSVASSNNLLGDLPATIAAARAALTLAEANGDDTPLAVAARILGDIHGQQGAVDVGEHWVRFAMAAHKRSGASAEEQVSVKSTLATLLMHKGELQPGVTEMEDALALAERLMPDKPYQLFRTRMDLASFQANARNVEQAAQLHEANLKVAAEVLGPNHPLWRYTLQTIGTARLQQGRFAEARALLEKGLAMPGDPNSTAHLELSLGSVDESEANRAGAARHFEAARDLFREKVGPESMLALVTTAKAASARYLLGERRESLAQLMALKARVDKASGPADFVWVETYSGLAIAYAESREDEKALELTRLILKRAPELGRKEVVFTAQLGIGQLLLQKKDNAQALVHLQEAVKGLEAYGGVDHVQLAIPLTYQGLAQLRLGDVAGAQASLQRAVALWKQRAGVWRDRADAAEGLAQVRKREGGDAKEIARLEEEARLERARVVKNGWAL